MEMTCEFPMIFPSLNEVISLAKSHWSEYSRLKQHQTSYCRIFASKLPYRIRKPSIIRFDWYTKNKRIDPDNYCAVGRKFILDGLVEARKLPSDGRKLIMGFEDHFAVDKRRPRCEITVREVE